MSAASLDRRSAKVCPASEKNLSDDVLDAGTLGDFLEVLPSDNLA